MNGDSAHLSLEELVWEANGTKVPGTHLASCQTCQAEVASWAAVGSGVRLLTDTSPGPQPLERALVTAGDGPRARPWWRPAQLAEPRRRSRLVSVAAALAVLAGGSYVVTAGLHSVPGGSGRPAGDTASAGGSPAPVSPGLTSVTGCPGLKAVVGTLRKASGTSLVFATAGGQQVTVATSAATRVQQLVAGSLSRLTEGSAVVVSGTDVNGTLNASLVIPLPAADMRFPAGGVAPSGQSLSQLLLRTGHAMGTVHGLTGSGFTVAGPGDSRVPVSVSSSTVFARDVRSTTSQLKVGETAVAIGHAGDNGTLVAAEVEQDEISGEFPHPAQPSGQQVPASPRGGNCAAGAVASAFLAGQ